MVKAAFVFLILTSQLSEVDAADRQTNSRATYEAIATTAATLQAVRAIINWGWGTSDLLDWIRTDAGDNPNQDHNKNTESARTDFTTIPDIFTSKQEFESEVDTIVRVIGGNEPHTALLVETLRESPNTLLVFKNRDRNRSRFHYSASFWEIFCHGKEISAKMGSSLNPQMKLSRQWNNRHAHMIMESHTNIRTATARILYQGLRVFTVVVTTQWMH